MRKLLITLTAALLTFGFAQFNDSGVVFETDEFEGYTQCYQMVQDGDFAYQFLTDDTTDLIVWRIMVWGDAQDLPYNIFGDVPGDEVLVKLGEDDLYVLDILTVHPAEFHNGTLNQLISLPMDPPLMELILDYSGEVRMRLNGSEGRIDFTFTDAARAAFSSQFMLNCVPAPHGS